MPKGEYDTPGPFRADAKGVIWKTIGPSVSHSCTTVPKDFDAAEIEELIGLLNKGTHFDGMLAALKHARDNCISHPDQMIDDAIAKAEGKGR